MNIKNLLLTLMVFSFLSCKHAHDFEEIYKFANTWYFFDYVDLSKENFKEQKINIPPGDFYLIFEIGQNGPEITKSFSKCIYYKIDKEKNESSLISINKDKKCISNIKEESILAPIKNKILTLKSIFLTRAYLDKNHESLNLEFVENKRARKINISKLNRILSKNVNLNLNVNSNSHSNISHIEKNNYCFKVDDQCNPIEKDLCYKCENQDWYYSFEGKCKKLLNKRCGKIICGQKDEIACLRGLRITAHSGEKCMNDAPIAFCHKGLRVKCENDQLVCKDY